MPNQKPFILRAQGVTVEQVRNDIGINQDFGQRRAIQRLTSIAPSADFSCEPLSFLGIGIRERLNLSNGRNRPYALLPGYLGGRGSRIEVKRR